MTSIQARTEHDRPRHAHRHAIAHQFTHPFDHAPGALLALAALLVVVAGPVAQALAPGDPVVGGVSVVLLAAGVLLAVVAGIRLLRRT